jgi:predicted phage-related endonuclease
MTMHGPQYLEERRKGIGGSDIAAVLGLSPWKTAYQAIYSGRWMTLDEIHQATGDPEASISAQLRHLRKYRFGAHDIRKRRRNGGNQWEYRLWRIG